MHGGGMCGRGGGAMCGREACMTGVCVWQEEHAWWRRGVSVRRDGHCSGRYGSYWNAFLFLSMSYIYTIKWFKKDMCLIIVFFRVLSCPFFIVFTIRKCGYVMISVKYVCCLCMCVTFEQMKLRTSFSCVYIFTTSRSGLRIKVIRSRSRSNKYNFIIRIILIHACIALSCRSTQSQCNFRLISYQI